MGKDLPVDQGADAVASRLTSGEAWRAFCDRLRAVGDSLLGSEFPGSDIDRTEGFRHLTRLTVFALQWHVEFADRGFPAFYRFNDDVVKWGAPNNDNHYYRAAIDPTGTYRVSGNVSGVRQLIMSTPEGDMQLDKYRVFEERNLSQLQIGPDGEFEVILSPDPQPGNWIPLHPGVDHVLVRQYVSDWDRDAVAALRIERLDNTAPAPEPLRPGALAQRLDAAAEWIERSTHYWNTFAGNLRHFPPNQLSEPHTPAGGARDILYGGGWWQLGPDEALIVECAVPDAQYWSIQLYSFAWFESLDVAHRQNSLSGHQIAADGDGCFRVVIAHEDPGVQNWLDTEGRTDGVVSYRWVWSRTAPTPRTTVVPFDAIRQHLPAGVRAVTRAERRRELARRAAAIARRFRI